MATKIRQIVPMAGTYNVRYAGQVYVASDSEAKSLASAGIAEILETGLKDKLVDLPSIPDIIPEGAMAAPAGFIQPEQPVAPVQEAAVATTKATRSAPSAVAAESGAEAGGDSQQPPA